MIEDLMPFILMMVGMVAIAVFWAVHTIRQAFTTKAEREYYEDARNAETSAGVGGSWSG